MVFRDIQKKQEIYSHFTKSWQMLEKYKAKPDEIIKISKNSLRQLLHMETALNL